MQNQHGCSRRRFVKKSVVGFYGIAMTGVLTGCSDRISGPEQEKIQTAIPVGAGERGAPIPPTTTDLTKIPQRILGKTGMQVSVLAFGGGSNFMANENGHWESLLQHALDQGVNYFDTSNDYDGSEARYAEILGPMRQKVYITTKINGLQDGRRKVDVMMRELETSLKRLKTDYLDILMIHAVNNQDTVQDLALMHQQMSKLKEQGVIKNIGFSSMDSAAKSREIIRALDFDVCMLAINPTLYGDYETIAVPEAIKKNMGILAMKVMRDVVGKNGVTAEELMRWALDREGVSAAVIAHYGLFVLEQNAAIAKQFHPTKVSKQSWVYLEERLKAFAGPHALSWARPGYRDFFHDNRI